MPEATYTILCVDDEVGILKALNRLLRRAGYRVLAADSGGRGLEILKKEPVNLIISDQRMPGMQGNEFLRLSREICPDAVRIMLTAHADINAATAAINQGKVYKFILKPWNDSELLETIKGALREQDLTFKNRRLTVRIARQHQRFTDLTKSLQQKVGNYEKEMQSKDLLISLLRRRTLSGYPGFIDTMVEFLKMRSPAIANHSMRVSAGCRQVAQKICKDRGEVDTTETAATLHDIGKIGMPETILHKPLGKLTPQELELMQSHPVLGEKAIQMLPSSEDIRELIRSHHENFDGSGYPDGLKGNQIPLASCIIAVVNAYDNMCYSQTFGKMYTPEEARKRLEGGTDTLYSPEVVESYLSILEEEMHYAPERPICLVAADELEEGMVLARDLYTIQNALLLATGTVIGKKALERIQQHEDDDRPGEIYIVDDSGE